LYYLEQKDVAVLLAGMRMVWNLGPGYVEKFNSVYPELADEFSVVFMPFFLEGVATVPRLNLADGVHPNEQGYKVITDNIYPYVLETIKRAKNIQ
ncbi:MAG: SGNH/GDSL hydrolase family protein, partial [Desulforhopalus sp.]